MQGGDQPDRRRMAFLGSQALLVAGQRPFRRPGRFVLGLLDVLAMRWRAGFLRRPRPPLTLTGGCHSRTASVGEQFGHLRRVDVLQRRVAPAWSVVAVHEQGAHTLDEVWRACERAAEHQVLLENLAQRVHVAGSADGFEGNSDRHRRSGPQDVGAVLGAGRRMPPKGPRNGDGIVPGVTGVDPVSFCRKVAHSRGAADGKSVV